MPLDRCLFALQLAHPAERDEAERRVRALERFYAPLGARAAWRYVEPARALVGGIGFDGAEVDPDALLWFGERPPPGLDPVNDSSLRGLAGATAVMIPGERSVTVVSSACPPAALYTASSESTSAWSTHSVAAGWLGLGAVRVDPTSIPEFLAAEFVGGDRTLLEGVTTVPSATSVELGEGGASTRCWWPIEERWALLPPSEAQEHGEREFLAALDERLRDEAKPFCALTAGLDSRAVAVALNEIGIPFEAYTWGESDWPDVAGGAEVARVIGVKHHFQPLEWFADADGLRFVDADVRWTEGLIHVGFGRPTWPAGMSAFVTGAGGETGRCFYYRNSIRARSAPDAQQLKRVLLAWMGGRLAAAQPSALETLGERLDDWIADAEAAGHRGWRCLDVVYAEQRVRRWLRGMLPRSSAPMVPAFAPPEVARALLSLPLSDRASDAFHRRLIARCRPALEPPAPPPPPRRAGLPPVLRRLRARVPGLRRSRPAPPSALSERWQERPLFREWVADEVLGSPLIRDSLGERWAAGTRSRFLEGDAHGEEMALWAGGPVALASALRDLA